MSKTQKLSEAQFAAALQTGRIYDGAKLFELKATHGFPLEVALDKIITERGMAVDWVGFIEQARKNLWWDFQTYELICYAMIDADIPKQYQNEIKYRFQLYVVNNPHPRMKE